jgi:sphingolipid 8-(E)-desaturase
MSSRNDILVNILQGQNILLYRGHILRIPHSWLAAHPGGHLSILHFVGRDATDEIDAYHCEKTIKTILKYSVGTWEGTWEPFLPPIDQGWYYSPETKIWRNERCPNAVSSAPTIADLTPPPPIDASLSLETQQKHSEAYRALHKRIIAAGLYECPYWSGYGVEIVRGSILLTTCVVAYVNDWQKVSAIFLGLFWHQNLFCSHDLGHMGVTHDWAYDRLIAIFGGCMVQGLSIDWWVQVCPLH